jgi:hypothetical protein
VAVKVTDWPKTDELAEETTLVVVDPVMTTGAVGCAGAVSADVVTANVLPAYEPAAGLVTPVIVILTAEPAVRQVAYKAFPMVTVTTEPATLVAVTEQLELKPCVKVTVGEVMVNAGLKVITTDPVE